MPKSFSRFSNPFASVAVFTSATNSDSADERVTHRCVRLQDLIKCVPMAKIPPEVDNAVFRHPAQSASEYKTRRNFSGGSAIHPERTSSVWC